MISLELDERDNNYLLLRCKFQDKEKAKSVNDATWDKERKAWRFPATFAKVKALKQVFPEILVSKQANDVVEKNRLTNETAIKIKQLSDCDIVLPKLKTKLFNYQKVGVMFMLCRNEAGNFSELGTGKTLQTLATIISRKENVEIKKCLVVTPASLKYNWRNEIEKHTYEKSVIVDGSKKKRMEQYQEFKDANDILFLVINYELLRADIDLVSKYLILDAIVLDESIKIKNSEALQTKAVKKLSKLKYKYILSGYPIANNLEDIHSQIDFLKPGHMGSWWSFEDNYIIRGYFKNIEGYRNIEHLKKRLDPLYIRFLKKDVLDLPEKIYEKREVTLEKDQMMAYNQMRDEMIVYVEKLNEKEIISQTRDILVKLIRLSQITSGFISDEKFESMHNFESNAKLPVLEDIVDEVVKNDKPIVIWCRFLNTVKLIADKLSKKYNVAVITGSTPTKERQEIVDNFQDGKIQVFIGQILACGMGLNLFKADCEVFFEKAFLSPSSVIQAEERIHRIGQKNNVTIISLLAKNTLDERWEKMLLKKREISEQILDDKKVVLDKQIIMDFLKGEDD
jgi:SNF2 family DNA or RNA helicase